MLFFLWSSSLPPARPPQRNPGDLQANARSKTGQKAAERNMKVSGDSRVARGRQEMQGGSSPDKSREYCRGTKGSGAAEGLTIQEWGGLA